MNQNHWRDCDNEDVVDQESINQDEFSRSKMSRTISVGPNFLTRLLENEPQSYKEIMSSIETS